MAEGDLQLMVLRQPVDTTETRAARHGALLEDIVAPQIPIDRLFEYAKVLRQGTAVPVGSVEYVRAAMRVAEIPEPANMSYPASLIPFLSRQLMLTTAANLPVSRPAFVKPAQTKTFTGFLYDPGRSEMTMTEHDREQKNVLLSLPGDTPIWISTPVIFQSEWRYYLLSGNLIGSARYDADGADDAPRPDMALVTQALTYLAREFPDPTCAMDFGVLESGETVLVECNDAWALGLYAHAVDPRKYLKMLITRWTQITQNIASS